ncbi:hypothetical protein KKC44_04920 [Patescibacteria group bacterium]|nr:hypothetical protein [Patescibacteria group bacterium]
MEEDFESRRFTVSAFDDTHIDACKDVLRGCGITIQAEDGRDLIVDVSIPTSIEVRMQLWNIGVISDEPHIDQWIIDMGFETDVTGFGVPHGTC